MVGPRDPRGLLPAEITVDASDRTRSGIRITLDRRAPAATVCLPPAVDCASGTSDSSLRSLEYTIVDVETTGGSWSGGHRVTEIAAVRLRGDGSIVDEFRTLVNPDRSIPAFISRLTAITSDMVRDAPRFDDVAPDVARLLGGAVFVAHNASFDWRFVSAEFERIGVPLRGVSLCTVRLARKVVPELRSRSLDALTGFFDIPVEARHRAWGDALATAELFRRLVARLDELEVSRWDELQELLAARAPRRRRCASPQPVIDA